MLVFNLARTLRDTERARLCELLNVSENELKWIDRTRWYSAERKFAEQYNLDGIGQNDVVLTPNIANSDLAASKMLAMQGLTPRVVKLDLIQDKRQ